MTLGDTAGSILKYKGRQIWSISPGATVYEAIETMSDRRVGALFVISGGQLVGIISERDYARKVILMGRSSKETRVEEIMSHPVIFVTPHETVDECMRIMTNRKIRHLPVLEHDQVVGMVSIGDLVGWIISAHEETIRHLHSYIAGAYPG